MPERTRAAIAVFGVSIVAVVATGVTLRGTERWVVAGPALVGPLGQLSSGTPICQELNDVPPGAERLEIVAGGSDSAIGASIQTPGRASPAGRARFEVPPREVDAHPLDVRVAQLDRPVPAGPARVCLRAIHGEPVVYGGPPSEGGPLAQQDDHALGGQIHLTFRTADSRPAIGLIPEVFSRAAVFRPSWIDAWTFWVILALVVLGIPLAMVRALGLSEESPEELDVDFSNARPRPLPSLRRSSSARPHDEPTLDGE